MNDNELRNDRLIALSAMKDYKVAKDNPDVLGWRVVGADGESLGIVRDLIVDPKVMKAHYLSVVADRKFFKTDSDQHLLVPIGAAALDKKGRKVFLSAIDSNSIGRYPVYQGGPITEDYEYAVRDTYQRSQRDVLHDDPNRYKEEFDEALNRSEEPTQEIREDFYNTDTYNEDRFYTSDQEVYRDRTYPTYVTDQTSTTIDTPQEVRNPQSVEDSIATIERLEMLRERGALTSEEFITLKKRALDL
ncbi:PRC-barrel domain-containing protein [Pontibacter sp. BT310]|uniref:PRC-barrel domain-containing protein n=1 Tax=Pontibacter populi TaxID=890055 RepID=A0ABS6XAR4_9BACT|nr:MULTISPECIES: PRC-barrel domain-containing protein [Pontibacter]MBJ6118230.1 PRC-barrel domain-containing protein [Pontibacter sp. BT310]MBR0570657.1 PRC-barrel domain-containing protein [Microvirga sp. STS03]MBW3365083.1 PRC-barrel domain-containing protein [Pontibacter populi]